MKTYPALAFMALAAAGGYAQESSGPLPLPLPPALILVPGKLGERECSLILDTGSGFIALDQSLTRFRGRAKGDATVRDAGGGTMVQKLFELPDLRLGAFVSRNPSGFFMDVKAFSRYFGDSVHGILGAPAFAGGKLVLDYEARVLELHRGAWRLEGASVQEVALKPDRGAIILESAIEGVACSFVIDTGTNGCLSLEEAAFDTLVAGGAIKLDPTTGRTANLAGIAAGRSKRGWFLKGQFMGKELKGVSVSVGPSLIGIGWLCGFRTELDIDARKLRYALIKDARPPIAPEPLLGAILAYEDGRAVVESLQPGGAGAAERAGIKESDIIDGLGALKAGQFNEANVLEELSRHFGSAIRLGVLTPGQDTRREVTLKIPKPVSDWDFHGL